MKLRLGLAVLVLLIVGGCGRADHTTDQEALQKITAALGELKTAVQQQEVAIRQLNNGKQVSEDVDKKLASLEAVMANESQWPKSREEVKRLHDDLQEAIKQVPSAAEDALAPRIIPLRWNVEALWLLKDKEKPLDDEWDAVSSTCRSFLQAAPDTRNQALFTRLTVYWKLATAQAAAHRREAAIQLAKDAIADKKDPAVAWTALEPYESNEQGKDLPGLRRQLRVKLLKKTTEERLKVLQATFDHAKASGNDRRAQAAVARVYDAATGILLDLDIETPRPESAIKPVQALMDTCETELKAISRRQQAEAGGKARAYQAWALNQIKVFTRSPGWQYKAVYDRVRSDLTSFKKAEGDLDWEILKENPAIKDIIQEKVGVDMSQVTGSTLTAEKQHEIYNTAGGVTGWKGSVDSEIAYRATRDAMVKYLLPVNPAFLDIPVSQLYNKAFNDAWETLKDRPDDLLFVAEQAATVKKQGIE